MTTQTATHLLMTGGKLNVQDNSKFISEYHDAVQKNEKMSIVEKIDKGLRFKMFFDIDNKQPVDDVPEFITQLMVDSEKIKPNLMAIICVGQGTHGFHIIFQRWNVDSNEANAFVSKLKYDIDTSVYNTGLRMPFSIKRDVEQFYYPKYLWKDSSLTALEQDDMYDIRLLEGCCIRTQYKNKYSPLPVIEQSKSAKNIMTNFIRSINSGYKDANILSLKKIKNYITCLSDSKYCMNINSHHGKNHVYFVISNKVMYQKCHCKKYNCENFKSKSFNVPWILQEEIKKVC